MFLGSLKTEIQAFVWRSWSSLVYLPPLCIGATALECTNNAGENWTNQCLDGFGKWSISRLLNHLWTSNKVYLEAETPMQIILKNSTEYITINFPIITFSEWIIFFFFFNSLVTWQFLTSWLLVTFLIKMVTNQDGRNCQVSKEFVILTRWIYIK